MRVDCWQNGYDTEVGPKVVKETGYWKIANHPSVVIWTNCNEGRWDLAIEPGFINSISKATDTLNPWLQRNGFDTLHYPRYERRKLIDWLAGPGCLFAYWMASWFIWWWTWSRLEDFWESYTSPSIGAEVFFVFADEAFWEKELGGKYDSMANHAPDGSGTLPERRREVFYTTKTSGPQFKSDHLRLTPNFERKNQSLQQVPFLPPHQSKLEWEIEDIRCLEIPNTLFEGTDWNYGWKARWNPRGFRLIFPTGGLKVISNFKNYRNSRRRALPQSKAIELQILVKTWF